VKLTITHDPTALTPHQNVALDLTGTWAAFSGTWRIREATLSLNPSGGTLLTVSQVTDTTTEVTI
jgi:hypothetical protein